MKKLIFLLSEKKLFLIYTLLPTFILKFISSLGVVVFNITIIFSSNENTLGLFTIGLSLITFATIISRIGLNGAILRFTSITIHQKKAGQFKNEIIFTLFFTLFISLAIIIFFIKILN